MDQIRLLRFAWPCITSAKIPLLLGCFLAGGLTQRVVRSSPANFQRVTIEDPGKLGSPEVLTMIDQDSRHCQRVLPVITHDCCWSWWYYPKMLRITGHELLLSQMCPLLPILPVSTSYHAYYSPTRQRDI